MRLAVALAVSLLVTPGCITIWTRNRIAPRRVEVPPSRIEVVKDDGGSGYHVLVHYDDGSTARWIASSGQAHETSPYACLPEGRPLVVTSLEAPDEGEHARVERRRGDTELVIVTEHGRISRPIDVDGERLPSWWRATLWVAVLPLTIALDLVTWPVTVPWAWAKVMEAPP